MPMQSYGNSARHLRRRTCETVCIMRTVSRLWSPCAASVGESCSVARACTPTYAQACPSASYVYAQASPSAPTRLPTPTHVRLHVCPGSPTHLRADAHLRPCTPSRAHLRPCLRVGVCGSELRVCVGLRGCTRLRMGVYVCALVRASRNTEKTHAPSSVRRLCLSCGRYVPVLCLASSASCEADSCQTSCALCVPVWSQSVCHVATASCDLHARLTQALCALSHARSCQAEPRV